MRLEAQSRAAICLKVLIRLIGVGSSVAVLILFLDELNEAFPDDQFGRGGRCAFLGDQGSCRFGVATASIAVGLGALAMFLDTWVLRDDELEEDTRLHVLKLDLVGLAIVTLLWLSVFINSTVLWVNTLDDRDTRELPTDNDLKTSVIVTLALSLASSIIHAILFILQKLSLNNLEL